MNFSGSLGRLQHLLYPKWGCRCSRRSRNSGLRLARRNRGGFLVRKQNDIFSIKIIKYSLKTNITRLKWLTFF